jgi:hypothetical protein
MAISVDPATGIGNITGGGPNGLGISSNISVSASTWLLITATMSKRARRPNRL